MPIVNSSLVGVGRPDSVRSSARANHAVIVNHSALGQCDRKNITWPVPLAFPVCPNRSLCCPTAMSERWSRGQNRSAGLGNGISSSNYFRTNDLSQPGNRLSVMYVNFDRSRRFYTTFVRSPISSPPIPEGVSYILCVHDQQAI